MRIHSSPIALLIPEKLALWGTLMVAAVLFTGCWSPQKKVERQMEPLRARWAAAVARQANLPTRELDWTAAVEQTLAHNFKLIQARMEITNSIESVRQIFRDLTPILSLRGGWSKRLGDLGSTTLDDITYGADTFFNVPGLVTFPTRLYTARLTVLRAQVAYELSEREQIITLYKLFIGAQEPARVGDSLEQEKAAARAIHDFDPFTASLMMTQAELRELGNLREMDSIQQQAGELFGDRSFRWVLVTNNLPELDYVENPLPLLETERTAQLQLKLAALELEAARVQLLGVKLRYWPDLNIFISSPPLYQNISGEEFFWKAADVQAHANVYWQLDTRGYISRQLRLTQRQQALQKARLEQDALALIDRLLVTRQLLEQTTQRLRETEFQLEVLEAVPPAQSFLSLQKYADDLRTLTDTRIRLRRELSDLQTLFWFVDDAAWPARHENPSS